MLRISVVTIAVLLVAGPAALCAIAAAATAGEEFDHARQRSGTRRLPSGRDPLLQAFLREDGQDDVFAILGCLQTNRGKISNSCQQVLASHGQ